jgi:hypothetical protein
MKLPDLCAVCLTRHAPCCVPPVCEERLKSVPVELDKIADVCLNYRPKSRAKKAKRRKKRKAKKNV